LSTSVLPEMRAGPTLKQIMIIGTLLQY
jgi:hypothetical protein